MKMKTLMALAVGAALALPLSTLADDKPGNTPEGRAAATFKSLDSDNDGHLSSQEMKGNQHEGQFSNLDQDRDGLLAFHEYMVTAGAGASASAGAGRSPSDGHWDQRYRRAHGGASSPMPRN
jgi:hypothetical protein